MMKYTKFIIGFGFCLCFQAYAANLHLMNSLISTPGFSVDYNGDIVTNWKPSENNRQPGKPGRSDFNSGLSNSVIFSYKAPDHLKTPDWIYARNVMKRQYFFAELNTAGNFSAVQKCEMGNCATVSKGYCERIYKDLKITSARQLNEKITQCSNLEKIDPSAIEIKELSRIWKKEKDIFENLTIAPSDRGLREVSERYDGAAAKLDSWHNSFFNVHKVKGSPDTSKMLLISELCKTIVPELAQPSEVKPVVEQPQVKTHN